MVNNRTLPLKHYFPNVSQLVYGCMALGGDWDTLNITKEDRVQAEKAIAAALEANINVFDHADIYRQGKAEVVFGEFLKLNPNLRENIIIQSKCGIRFEDDKGPKRYDLSKKWILHSVEKCLQRLNTDYLDILLLHRPDPLMEVDEIADTFRLLLESGKVNKFGVSNMHGPQMRALNNVLDEPICVNQLEMSLTNLGWLEESVFVANPEGNHINFTADTLEYAARNKVQLQSWGAMSQGKYSGGAELLSTQEKNTYQCVTRLAACYEVSEEAVILSWLMRHPATIQPVIGTANPERIKRCAQSTEIGLSREDWYSLFVSARQQELP